MDDLIKAVIGLVAAGALGLSSWLMKLAHDLDKRVTVLEKRPVVDPYIHIEEITKLNAQLMALTAAMAENTAARREQYNELRAGHERLTKELDEIRSDVKQLLSRNLGGPAR